MLDWRIPYIAGVIDADGYITIGRNTKKPAGDNHRIGLYYCLKVGIAGTDRRPHDLAASIFGGNVYPYTPKNKAHRVQFQWNTSGEIAKRVLLSISPYLVIKGRQADLGLQLQNALDRHWAEMRRTQRPPFRITDAMALERMELWSSVVALNKPRNQRANKGVARLGRKAAGNVIDGREWHEFPA